MRCLEQAVRLGNADAMYQMGDVYRYGLGVSKDDKLARQWYEPCSTGMKKPKKNWPSR